MHEHAIDKIHRDHSYLIELMQKIESVCARRGLVKDCRSCDDGHRMVCQGNVEQLVKTFVEGVLKHHMVESAYMSEGVPKSHRIAHAQAHLAIAEQLRAIRIEFSADGNCITAVEGVEAVFQSIIEHIETFDAPLEEYLLATA